MRALLGFMVAPGAGRVLSLVKVGVMTAGQIGGLVALGAVGLWLFKVISTKATFWIAGAGVALVAYDSVTGKPTS